LAQPRQKSAEANHAMVLGGRALDARALAGAPVGLGGNPPVGPMSRLSGTVQPPRARTWLWLSNSEQLDVDRVTFACGYRADLSRVRYLTTVLDRIEIRDAFRASTRPSVTQRALHHRLLSAARLRAVFRFRQGIPSIRHTHRGRPTVCGGVGFMDHKPGRH
jgi:hypothetical protein